MPIFTHKFELSNFELEIDGRIEAFRFDFFRQWMNETYWLPNSKFLPEFQNLCRCSERGLRHDGDHSLRLAAGEVIARHGALKGDTAPYLMYSLRTPLRLGWRSLRRALASI